VVSDIEKLAYRVIESYIRYNHYYKYIVLTVCYIIPNVNFKCTFHQEAIISEFLNFFHLAHIDASIHELHSPYLITTGSETGLCTTSSTDYNHLARHFSMSFTVSKILYSSSKLTPIDFSKKTRKQCLYLENGMRWKNFVDGFVFV